MSTYTRKYKRRAVEPEITLPSTVTQTQDAFTRYERWISNIPPADLAIVCDRNGTNDATVRIARWTAAVAGQERVKVLEVTCSGVTLRDAMAAAMDVIEGAR